MRNRRSYAKLIRLTIVALTGSVLASCGGDTDAPTPTFEVDPSVKPAVGAIPFVDGNGERPVASIEDNKGNKVDFVENEAIVALEDPARLDDVLSRLNATVIREVDPKDNGAPTEVPAFYLLRVDPVAADPQELVDLILGSEGDNNAVHRVSSQRGLDLLTAIARESETMGTDLGANFLTTYDTLSERSTMEAETANAGAGYSRDAFAWPYMSRGSRQDIGAAEAARLVHDAGRVPPEGSKVDFLIIDAGFSSTADYPTPTLVGPTALDVRNPSNCSGGNSCPWHGTWVASTALSMFDDGIGGAGPASEVAHPIFVQAPNPNFWDYLEYIFVTLPSALLGLPDIVNISSSADIPAGLCLVGVCTTVDRIASSVRAAGILVFASAGNDGANVDAEDCFVFDICWEEDYRAPCEAPGVICVGGLLHQTTARDPSSAAGRKQRDSSDSVDIYAPFWTWVHDDPDGGTTNAKFVPGTSFSAPFAASIGALIKAANPSLGPSGIWDIMRDNAHTISSGGVHRWVDAYASVRAALGGNAPPFAQVRTPNEASMFSWNASSPPLSCEIDDDMGSGDLDVSWSSDIDGAIGAMSPNTSAGLLSFGRHEIECSASDGTFTVTDTVTIEIVNDPPTMTITQPADGARFFAGQAIPLMSRPIDINDDVSNVSWDVISGGSAILWSGSGINTSIPASTLTPGVYAVRSTVVDSMSASGVDTIALFIDANPADLPPSVVPRAPIATPDDPLDNPPGSYWADACTVDVNGPAPGNGDCQRLFFSATVTDDHDPIAALDFDWEVRESGALVDTRSTVGEPSATFDLVVGSYEVTLIATDSGDNSSEPVHWTFVVETLI
jgi:serine protease